MKYEYDWLEFPSHHFDMLRSTANADLLITTDDGRILLQERYVPLIDFAIALLAWNIASYFEFTPEGYDGQMLELYPQDSGFLVKTPDSICEVILGNSETYEFIRGFTSEVGRDILERTGYTLPTIKAM